MTASELNKFLLNKIERGKERELFGPAEGPIMCTTPHCPPPQRKSEENYTGRLANCQNNK